MDTLSKRLQAFRRQSGLSISEVAARIGVAESTYREWEGGRKIQGEPYLKLAQTFDVTLSEIIIGEEGALRRVIDELNRIDDAVKKIRSSI